MSKLEAHLDARLPPSRQFGKMSCYCKENKFNPTVKFDEYKTFNFTNYQQIFKESGYSSSNYGYIKSDQRILNDAMARRDNIF